MKLLFAWTFAFLAIHGFAQSPNFQWVNTMGATGLDAIQSVATDSIGNIYATGYFSGTIDADPGAGVATLSSHGGVDAFVGKFDPSGNLLWAFSYGAGTGDVGYGIAVSPGGNVYVTGYFSGLVDFDPSTGIDTLRNADDPCNTEIYILKVDQNGNHLWVKRIAGIITWCTSATDVGQSIAVDAQENVYVTGQFQGTADFNTSEAPGDTFKLRVNGGAMDSDFFILKINASGDFQWVRRADCQLQDVGYNIHVDEKSGVFVAGVFGDWADFDPGPGTDTIQYIGNWDMFLLNLNKDGNYRWAHGFGTTGDDRSYGITTDEFGNAYVTGMFWGIMDIDPGTAVQTIGHPGRYNIVIAKFDTLGHLGWANALTGPSAGYYRRGNSMSADRDGGIYITGEFSDSMDFNPGTGAADTLWLKSNGASTTNDVFIQRYTLTGNMDWTLRIGGTGNDIGTGISVDGNGNIMTCGKFGSTVDFDPGFGTVPRTSAGSTDGFILKLAPIATGLSQIDQNMLWELWPNPSKGRLYISGPDNSNAVVHVFDLTGHVILKTDFLQQISGIDLTTLPAGMYIVKVITDETEVFSARFMHVPE